MAWPQTDICPECGAAVYVCDCWSGKELESGNGEVPRHQHKWSLLTSSDGSRQCLGRDCFAIRFADGEIVDEGVSHE